MNSSSLAAFICLLASLSPVPASDAVRTNQLTATSARELVFWQNQARKNLFELMMGGGTPNRVPLDAKILQQLGDERIEILEGLKEGDEVVTGSYRAISKDLVNGAVVKINNEKQPAKADESGTRG